MRVLVRVLIAAIVAGAIYWAWFFDYIINSRWTL